VGGQVWRDEIEYGDKWAGTWADKAEASDVPSHSPSHLPAHSISSLHPCPPANSHTLFL